MNNSIASELLTETEAARLLGLSVACLRKWRWENRRRIERGEPPVGPPWRKLGRAVRYPKHALTRWLESQPGCGRSLE